MTTRIFFAALLGLVFLGVCNGATSKWDFMLFEQQWAPGVCLTEHGKTCVIPHEASDGFTIHGSWPSSVGQEGPFYCNESYPFSPGEIQDLLQVMQSYWPSLYGGDTDFWSHEWTKHGTCVELPQLDTEHEFFQFVVNLRKHYDLKQSLEKAKIVPGSAQYSVEDMAQAVKSDIGFTPLLMCAKPSQRAEHPLDGQVLIGAGLCVGRDLQLTECSSEMNQSCVTGVPVLYPPHRS